MQKLDLPTEKKKFKLGTEIFGKTKLDYPKPEVERAIKSIQNLKRLTDDTGKEIGVSVEDVMDFGSPSLKNLTEEQIRSIYDMVEADQDSPIFAAEGGRIGYARGDSAEDNAMQAAGVMGLPLNQNPAGITELDLRETGGFIPPVGVKEKADDIPAMLSNNEFVFTADAVRGMGDGDVNKGAQRMYDMMKRLENGGRV